MATTLLPSSQHHFGPASSPYVPVAYSPYQAHPAEPGNPSGASSPAQQSYTSPQRWAAQQVFQRRPSKSPNIRDRTPIRHNRPEMSRHRSSSRPDMMYAYAEEQVRQTQQAHNQSARVVFMPSAEPSAQVYQPQSYGFPPMGSSYLQHSAFFDTSNTGGAYSQLQVPSQQDTTSSTLFATARQDAVLQQASGNTLNPSDTIYNTPRSTPLSSLASVPSHFPPIQQPLESTPNEVDATNSRQKPQCWDHGCNGRQFSTFSNLLRHQREKSGTATKARCPHCGTEFTRTTARNGHLFGGKCKGMPEQVKDEDNQPESDIH